MFPNFKSKFFTILILLAIAVLVVAAGSIFSSVLFGVFGVAIIVALYFGYKRQKEMRTEAYKESLDEGGIEESQIFRDLTDAEKARLEKMKGNDAYLDSRSPVFRVQGNSFVDILERKDSQRIDYSVNIRGLTFWGEQLKSVSADIENMVDKEIEIAVEYSPRTKHVWKIYKTEDI